MVNEIKNNTIEEAGNNGVVVIDFATWCGPCKMLAPVVDEISEDLAGKVTFYKADIDVNDELAAKFNIMSVPTVVVLKDGVKQKTLVGYKPKQDLLPEIESCL